MSVFEYFWHRTAGLFIVACQLAKGVNTALAMVSQTHDDEMPQPLAVVPLTRCARNLATTFAIAAPKADESAGVRLVVCLVGNDDYGDGLLEPDLIVLDAADLAQMDLLNWCVLDTSFGPALDLSHPEDNVPANPLISRVLAIGRDGAQVALALSNEGVARAATVRISADWGAPSSEADTPAPAGSDMVVKLKIQPVGQGTHVPPTVFRVHSLMAGSHVCAVLNDPELPIDPRFCNHVEIRMTQQSPTVLAEFPKIGARAGGDDAFRLGLLDRIVVTSPPGAVPPHGRRRSAAGRWP